MSAATPSAIFLPFPIRFHEFEEPDETFTVNGYRINAFRVLHRVVCYGYTVSIDRAGRFDALAAKEKKIPLRQCIGCRAMKPKKELVRVVRGADGVCRIDTTGRAAGRGAYSFSQKASYSSASSSSSVSVMLSTLMIQAA